jgi:hypothetical protein
MKIGEDKKIKIQWKQKELEQINIVTYPSKI